jgi:hypothetical protein
MPRECRAASTRQQREAIVQAVGHLLHPDRTGMRRRELDRQRDAIEMPADRANAPAFACTQRETRVGCARPGDEELNRGVAQNVVRVVPPRIGKFQLWNTKDLLTCDPEGFSACRDDRGVRAVRQKRFGQRRDRPDEVFAIIQDHA